MYKLFNTELVPFDKKILFPHGEWYEMLASTPTVILAFTFQFNLFPIYFSMKDKTPEKLMTATYRGVIMCGLIYIVVGILSYLMYGDLMSEGSILQSLLLDLKSYYQGLNQNSYMVVVLMICSAAFLTSSTMSIPLMFLSLKKNLLNTIIFCKKKLVKNQKMENIIKDDKMYKDIVDTEDFKNHEIVDKPTNTEININVVENTNINQSDQNIDINQNIQKEKITYDELSSKVTKLTKQSKWTKKTKQSRLKCQKIISEKIEEKYIGKTEKMIIIIILYICIVALTILIKLLSTVS